jgi:membrane fusion protein (multidrug efflux system)
VVQRRQIDTGDVRGDQVEVLEGLSEGERVVSAGQVKLRNGVEVVIVDDPTNAAGADKEASERAGALIPALVLD